MFKLLLRTYASSASVHQPEIKQDGNEIEPMKWNRVLDVHTCVVEFNTRQEADVAADRIADDATKRGEQSARVLIGHDVMFTQAIKLY